MAATAVLSMAASASDSGEAAALDCGAGSVNDRSDDREVPGDREIAPEDALPLAAFDQRLYLVEHGDVTPVELLRREPGGVERE